MTRTRLTMVCGGCGRETSRALRHCDQCACDLHAASPVAGICPGCRVTVRKTQIACFNCGRVLDAAALKEVRAAAPMPAAPRPAAERRRRRTTLGLVWPVRILGVLVTYLGGDRAYMYLDFFRKSQLFDQQASVVAYAAFWCIVFLVGAGLFVLSFSLKPEY